MGGRLVIGGRLDALIASEIRASGPMTFARFMELSLYHPELGYYRQPQARTTRGGDFLTVPEMHPIFGWTIAREISRLWDAVGRPVPFRLVEFGAGAGTLALAIFEGLRREASPLLAALEYEPVELNPHRLADLEGHFRDAGLADHLVSDGGPSDAGLVLANEFLDALPVHRVECRAGELRELYVGLEPGTDRLVEVASEPSTQSLAARLAAEEIELAEGQQAEICLGLGDWFADVDGRLRSGLVLLVDYGFEAAELYAPKRMAGTILAYEHHRASTELLAQPGGRDLTAHVDLTAVRSIAGGLGFADLGLATQSAFLVAAGLQDVLTAIQASSATSLQEYTLVRSAVRRLLDPRATGGFRVLLLGKEVADSIRLAGAA